jgi:hypothetical protein
METTAHKFRADRPGNGTAVGMLPEWCNAYAGLTDEEIADLEQTILTRADLTRAHNNAISSLGDCHGDQLFPVAH